MATSPSRDALIGQLVGGRYEVIRLIGRGGTGSIYEVRNVRLGHSFALKTLTGDAATNAEAVQRFRREADIVARIKHPNIVEIIDWDELPDGSPCIVMEYLRGTDLAGRIEERGQLPWSQIAVIGDQMLAALSKTHSSGVVHRDLKPHNVFLSVDDSGEERVKLLDFGVSKIRDSKSLQTMNDRLMGTPAYMAPEQAEGRSDEVGPHTDIWAMGVILHEMATGVLAFEGPSLPAILYAVCHGEPASVVEHRPDAPPAFMELIADALKRPIPDRLAEVGVMRARLRDALRDVADGIGAKPAKLRAPSTPAGMRSDNALAETLGTAPSMPAAALTTAPTGSRAWGRYAMLGLVVGGVAVVIVLATRDHSSGQPAAPPAEAVVLVVERADATTAVPVVVDAAVAPAVTADAAVAIPDAAVAAAHTIKKPASFVDQVTLAIGHKMGALGHCIEQSPDASSSEITATIDIAPNGHATSVTLVPDAVATSLAGGCLRARLLEVEYPTSGEGGKVAFPLRMRSR